jgi:bifunctional N-acetylglucosamine-1-phosphate-uridyltransferase/glucosamine-1-phosphate-acetyltransferase GlmU-like protein
MSDRPTSREDSPMYRQPGRIKHQSLTWHLAKLEVGQVHLIEVKDSAEYRGIYNRTGMSRNAKALQGRQFSCQLLHCESMHDPSTTYLIARIERLQDKENT